MLAGFNWYARLCGVRVRVLSPPYRGDAFFDTNAELLERYAACPTAADVIAVQNEFLEAANTRREGAI